MRALSARFHKVLSDSFSNPPSSLMESLPKALIDRYCEKCWESLLWIKQAWRAETTTFWLQLSMQAEMRASIPSVAAT